MTKSTIVFMCRKGEVEASRNANGFYIRTKLEFKVYIPTRHVLKYNQNLSELDKIKLSFKLSHDIYMTE